MKENFTGTTMPHDYRVLGRLAAKEAGSPICCVQNTLLSIRKFGAGDQFSFSHLFGVAIRTTRLVCSMDFVGRDDIRTMFWEMLFYFLRLTQQINLHLEFPKLAPLPELSDLLFSPFQFR